MQHNWNMDCLEEFVLHKKITFPKNFSFSLNMNKNTFVCLKVDELFFFLYWIVFWIFLLYKYGSYFKAISTTLKWLDC